MDLPLPATPRILRAPPLPCLQFVSLCLLFAKPFPLLSPPLYKQFGIVGQIHFSAPWLVLSFPLSFLDVFQGLGVMTHILFLDILVSIDANLSRARCQWVMFQQKYARNALLVRDVSEIVLPGLCKITQIFWPDLQFTDFLRFNAKNLPGKFIYAASSVER